MFTYSRENLETVVRPALRDGENPIVLVIESLVCCQNDGKTTIWMEMQRRPLRSKDQRRSIMDSDYFCENVMGDCA